MSDLDHRANARVMAMIARALTDAQFLERLKREGGDLRQSEIRRLSLFAGFITRVQHNYLWESFPWVIRVLRHYRRDLALFERYVPIAQRLRAAQAGQTAKIQAFLDFVAAESLRVPRAYPGLMDVLRHERAIWMLRLGARGTEDGVTQIAQDWASVDAHQLGRLTPVLSCRVVVSRFRYDALDLIDRLSSGIPPKSALTAGIRARQRLLMYWLAADEGVVQRAEVDAVTAAIVLGINGKRRMRSVLERRYHPNSAPISLHAARPRLSVLASHGLLRFHRFPTRRTSGARLDAREEVTT